MFEQMNWAPYGLSIASLLGGYYLYMKSCRQPSMRSLVVPHLISDPAKDKEGRFVLSVPPDKEDELIDLARELCIEAEEVMQSNRGKPPENNDLYSGLVQLLSGSKYASLKETGLDDMVNEILSYDLRKICNHITHPMEIKKLWGRHIVQV